MGARQKLNAIYITVCSIAATAVGFAFQSWAAFALALSVGLALKAHDGGIRLARWTRGRPRQNPGVSGNWKRER